MPKPQPTRPDLTDDREWLVWLSRQPENRGIDIQGLFSNMIVWCSRKGLTPTRRRLLRWLADERDAVPIAYKPTFVPQPDEPPTPIYKCNECLDTGSILIEAPPETRKYTHQMIESPCPRCSK